MTVSQSYCILLPVFNTSFLKIYIKFKIEPVHEISSNMVCATSKASDQPAHMRRLIRAFASRLSTVFYDC